MINKADNERKVTKMVKTSVKIEFDYDSWILFQTWLKEIETGIDSVENSMSVLMNLRMDQKQDSAEFDTKLMELKNHIESILDVRQMYSLVTDQLRDEGF